jgi:ABC-type bacteriocin/lantibiotic exporter with double-glycine peptidase domain
MKNTFSQLWMHLSRRRQLQLLAVLVLMILLGLSEVISLGAVLPFLSVLLSPEKAMQSGLFGGILTDWTSRFDMSPALMLTIMFCAAILLASALRLAFLNISTRLAAAIGSDLSIEVYHRILHQPYSVHVARNSSEVIGAIVGKVNTTTNVIYQFLVLVCSAFMTLSLVSALIVIDARVAIISSLCFGVAYVVIGRLSRRMLRKNSHQIADLHTAQLKNLQEGLGGIRDVLLDSAQNVYCETFRLTDRDMRKALAQNTIVTGSPRYFMESIGTVLIVILAYQMSTQSGGFLGALPVLGGLAVAAQRLLPALQQSFAAWAIIAGSHASVTDTISMLELPTPTEEVAECGQPLALQRSISIETLSFRYAPDAPWALENVSLEIPRGARVGLIGETGSGKSTLLDLVMGLLLPTVGVIRVDGIAVTGGAIKAWQKTIAHVPQSIFLADSSIAENIAFGVALKDIDMDRVRQAARKAQIADFVEARQSGYAEIVGERGIRLSGGQRQRIGIARALYKQSTVLVLDEATSALDSDTEHSVMESVNTLDRSLTILMIAHRISTLKDCDVIVELKNGHFIAQGPYSALARA